MFPSYQNLPSKKIAWTNKPPSSLFYDWLVCVLLGWYWAVTANHRENTHGHIRWAWECPRWHQTGMRKARSHNRCVDNFHKGGRRGGMMQFVVTAETVHQWSLFVCHRYVSGETGLLKYASSRRHVTIFPWCQRLKALQCPCGSGREDFLFPLRGLLSFGSPMQRTTQFFFLLLLPPLLLLSWHVFSFFSFVWAKSVWVWNIHHH